MDLLPSIILYLQATSMTMAKFNKWLILCVPLRCISAIYHHLHPHPLVPEVVLVGVWVLWQL